MCMALFLINAKAFEGEIKYRTFRNASDEMLALQPLIFNGENTVTLVIKGDKMMMKDDRKGTITIFSNGMMTEYCPEDNSGYSCPSIDPSKSQSAQMKFPGKETDMKREMFGETATMYVCEKNANIGMEINGWVIPNNFGFSDAVASTLNSALNAPGLLVKWTMNTNGKYAMSFASEITAITPREVSDSEFDIIPANAKLEVVKDWNKYKFKDKQSEIASKILKGDMKNTMKLGDLVTHFMKTHPTKPAKIDAFSFDLDEDWNF